MYRKILSYTVTKYFKAAEKLLHSGSVLVPGIATSFSASTSLSSNVTTNIRFIHTSIVVNNDKKTPAEEQAIVTRDFFENAIERNKEAYLDLVRMYIGRSDKHRRGHVEFIYAALRHMEEFGVHKDLEAYKSLIDVLPKGKFIPQNIFQAEFLHYPKQQQCAIDALEQMEDNGVIPDFELEDILVNIFGKKGHPVRKFWRMMYWMPRFKNLSPWIVPNPVPDDSLELAKIAMQRMSSIDLQSKVLVYEASALEDSLDDTWIVSAQSPVQKELIEAHPKDVPIFVEGSFRVWLRNASVDYFILRADPRPMPEQPYVDGDDVGSLRIPFYHDDPSEVTDVATVPTVHEQDDGTILAMCASGTSSRDSLLSWVRHLEADGNPSLANIPVLFKLTSSSGEIAVAIDSAGEKEKIEAT